MLGALLRKAPDALAPALAPLLGAAAARLAAAESPQLIAELLALLAALAHADAPRLLDFLAAAHVPGAKSPWLGHAPTRPCARPASCCDALRLGSGHRTTCSVRGPSLLQSFLCTAASGRSLQAGCRMLARRAPARRPGPPHALAGRCRAAELIAA